MKQSQNSFFRTSIRISAFLFKEMLEIARQPMLLVTLVLGPFLILLFFGIGFRNQPQALRTLFVVEEDSPLAENIEQYATTLGNQLIFEGVISDTEQAIEQLKQGDIDLVVTIPSDPYALIRSNKQAVFDLYHTEINPIESDYVHVFGRVYIDEVNRRVLHFITAAGQVDVSNVDEKINIVREGVDTLKEALLYCADTVATLDETEDCDAETLNHYAQEVDKNVDELQLELGENANLSDATQQWLENDNDENIREELQPTLNRIVRNTNNLGSFEDINQDVNLYLDQINTLIKLETDLETIQQGLNEFAGINPQILVSPFRSEVINVALAAPTITGYFAPAVIVMLLQHLTVTFAALSLVRERLLGSIEVFSVSPISAIETLLGKYLSYLIFGVLLALVLFALVIFGIGVPLLGSWVSVLLTVLALIFTSLGIGFVISLISTTDTQAVQYSMIVLLTSVFFSGFILELHTLWEPVRIISWLLPATYGILSLRDIMLRGNPLDWALMAQLVAFGLILLLAAWVLLRRSMEQV